MNDKFTVRPHFVYVFALLYPYLSLLVIPVIRGFFQYFNGKSGTLTAFFTAEVLMLLIALLTAIFKLKRTKLEFDGHIKVQKGLFFKINYNIPAHCNKVIMLESDPISRLFGVYRLKIYTEAGTRRRPDERLPISRKSVQQICRYFKVEGQTVKSNSFGNIVMSAALSSSATGILLAFPLVKLAASLVGEGAGSLLKIVDTSSVDARWLNDAISGLPFVIGVGYVVSFAVILLRNCGFSTVKSGDKIMLDSGILPHRTVFFEAKSVNAIETVSAPLMRLVNKAVLKFSACGFGRSKGEIGLLVPCVKPQLAKGLAEWLLPGMQSPQNALYPDKKALKRSFLLPAAFLTLTVTAGVLLSNYFCDFGSVLEFSVIIAVILIIMWLAVRVLLVFVGCFSYENQGCKIVGRRGFGTVELKCPTENIEYITVVQNPFDIRHNHCSVTVRTSFKNRDKVKARCLDYEKVSEILKL